MVVHIVARVVRVARVGKAVALTAKVERALDHTPGLSEGQTVDLVTIHPNRRNRVTQQNLEDKFLYKIGTQNVRFCSYTCHVCFFSPPLKSDSSEVVHYL